MLYLYVPNADAAYQRALKAGATSVMEPADQFYGERTYRAVDPEGHVWNFHQAVDFVSPETAARGAGLTVRTALEKELSP